MIIFENVLKKNQQVNPDTCTFKGSNEYYWNAHRRRKGSRFFFINMTQYALCLISFINAHISLTFKRRGKP